MSVTFLKGWGPKTPKLRRVDRISAAAVTSLINKEAPFEKKRTPIPLSRHLEMRSSPFEHLWQELPVCLKFVYEFVYDRGGT